VYAITSLAAALGVRVTGEGTETASQLSTLVELDCKHGQGFLLGRPAPAGELSRAAADGQHRRAHGGRQAGPPAVS
jgi:EAL domain-containing protein (putative c-di-GMP-specific phosphodiesterase class I)